MPFLNLLKLVSHESKLWNTTVLRGYFGNCVLYFDVLGDGEGPICKLCGTKGSSNM